MATTAPVEVAPDVKPLFQRPAVLRLLAIALLAEIGYAVLNISTMPVYLKDDRGFGTLSISVVLVAFLLSEAVFKGPMGHLADRYGCKRLMLVGPALTFGTSLLSLAIPHGLPAGVQVAAFAGLRFVDGVGAAMLWPAAFAMMGNSVSDDERPQGMSLLNMCYLVGIALALPIGGIAEDASGSYTAGLYLAAVLFLAVAFTVWRFVRSDRPHEVEIIEGEGMSLRDFWATARQIPAYLILAAVTFAGIGFPMAIIKLFALDEFKLSGAQFGGIVFPVAIGLGIFSVPMTRMGEKLGRAKAVHLGMLMCSAGLLVCSLGAFFPAFRTHWTLGPGGIAVGAGFLLSIPAWLTSVADLNPKKRAANLGAVMTAQGLGAIVGAPLGGLMYQELVPVGVRLGFGPSFGHYSPFLGCAVCITIGWLISLKILKPPREITRSRS